MITDLRGLRATEPDVLLVGTGPAGLTLALALAGSGLSIVALTGGAPVEGPEGLPSSFVGFGSARFLGIHALVWIPIVLLFVLSWVMHATPYGRHIYATGGGREAAYLSGIAVDRITAGP